MAGNLNKPPEFPQGRETNQLESSRVATVPGPQQPTGLLKPWLTVWSASQLFPLTVAASTPRMLQPHRPVTIDGTLAGSDG